MTGNGGLQPGHCSADTEKEQVEGRTMDEKAIKAVLAEYEATWNNHDMKAWGKVKGEWTADTPMGKAKIRFAEKNQFGILDHDVILESGVTSHNPMRVLPNGRRSEVIFTLFRQPGMSYEKFSEDARWVEKDLTILRELLEK
jgi:hypothetical protein